MGVAAAWASLLLLGTTAATLASRPASVAPAIKRRSARVEMRLRGFTRRVSFQAVTKARESHSTRRGPPSSATRLPSPLRQRGGLASPFHHRFPFPAGGGV